MRKIINILAVAIFVAIGVGYFTVGPSFFLGGPKKSDIITVTRAVMIATAPSAAEVEKAKSAEISPRGLCNHDDNGSYACIVDTSIEGAGPKTFVTLMKKASNGDWMPAE